MESLRRLNDVHSGGREGIAISEDEQKTNVGERFRDNIFFYATTVSCEMLLQTSTNVI